MFKILISLLILLINSQQSVPDNYKASVAEIILQNSKLVQNLTVNDTDLISFEKYLSPTPADGASDNPAILTIKPLLPTITQYVKEYEDKKEYAYNIKSDKPVGEVAEKAIANSPALIPCEEMPDCPLTPTPIITLYPTLSLTYIPLPEPTYIPLPTICPDKDIYCPMIMCLEVHSPEFPPEVCGCSCNPLIL